MADLDSVESTLFIPLQGRVYCSRNFPGILRDDRALELAATLDPALLDWGGQSQYALMASAVRAHNVDHFVADFLARHPAGAVVSLGCGLETAFWRDDNGSATFFEVDLPDVIDLRRKTLGEPARDLLVAGSAFEDAWAQRVRASHPGPYLLVAAGLFHYFDRRQVLRLMDGLTSFGTCELTFDALNRRGMRRMGGYLRQLGHEDVTMSFSVDDARELTSELSVPARVLDDLPYYSLVGDRHGLSPVTRASFAVSDHLGMLRMIRLEIGGAVR